MQDKANNAGAHAAAAPAGGLRFATLLLSNMASISLRGGLRKYVVNLSQNFKICNFLGFR